MKIKKPIAITINIIYYSILLLFLIDWYTCVEIKSQALKSFVYWGLLAATPLALIFNAILLPRGSRKTIGIIIPVIFILFIIILHPFYIIISQGTWKTQTILFESNSSTNKKIEYQIDYRGVFGHNIRTVEVYYITPLFTVIRQAEPYPEKNPDWKKVDIEVNEFRWKYP